MKHGQRLVCGPYKVDAIGPVVGFVLDQIQAHERTLIRLHGDLGAGKTFLVASILHALGLNQQVPVQSPTFALMHEYKFGRIHAAHLDLYRLNGTQDLSEITGADFERYNLVFVEWSDRMGGGFDANLIIDIEIRPTDSADSRIYEIVLCEGKIHD